MMKQQQPWAPAGAPPRVIGGSMVFSVVFAVLMFGLTAWLAPYLALRIVGVVGIVALLAACLATKRKWDRIGWYQLRPIVAPTLPFRIWDGANFVTFQSEGIWFAPWFRRHRFIAYDEIRRVETSCVGVTLEGVKVCLSAHQYFGADNAPELIRERSPNGKASRAALAILRQKAPQATFYGPQWIEEGWVPRVGFSLVHPGGDGGAGF